MTSRSCFVATSRRIEVGPWAGEVPLGLIAWLLGDRPAPKIRYGDAVPPDQDYRLPDDSKYIIRIDRGWPDRIVGNLEMGIHREVGDLWGQSLMLRGKREQPLPRGGRRKIGKVEQPTKRIHGESHDSCWNRAGRSRRMTD